MTALERQSTAIRPLRFKWVLVEEGGASEEVGPREIVSSCNRCQELNGLLQRNQRSTALQYGPRRPRGSTFGSRIPTQHTQECLFGQTVTCSFVKIP